MGVLADDRLFRLIRDFLTVYLPKQKSYSQNTVKAYREALNLLLSYTADVVGSPLSGLTHESITSQMVSGFLDWLEESRGCSVQTRNHRLSCIRSFFKYARDTAMLFTPSISEISKVPTKKHQSCPPVRFFSEDALPVILAQLDTDTLKGTQSVLHGLAL